MQKRKDITPHTLEEWERALYLYCGKVAIEEFKLRKSIVVCADGAVNANDKWYSAQWSFSGKCYIKGRRAREYDIIFNL